MVSNLCGRSVSISYAFKREGHSERHGTVAERLLATEAKKRNMLPSQQAGQETCRQVRRVEYWFLQECISFLNKFSCI